MTIIIIITTIVIVIVIIISIIKIIIILIILILILIIYILIIIISRTGLWYDPSSAVEEADQGDGSQGRVLGLFEQRYGFI
jgi:hypothetical protein